MIVAISTSAPAFGTIPVGACEANVDRDLLCPLAKSLTNEATVITVSFFRRVQFLVIRLGLGYIGMEGFHVIMISAKIRTRLLPINDMDQVVKNTLINSRRS